MTDKEIKLFSLDPEDIQSPCLWSLPGITNRDNAGGEDGAVLQIRADDIQAFLDALAAAWRKQAEEALYVPISSARWGGPADRYVKAYIAPLETGVRTAEKERT